MVNPFIGCATTHLLDSLGEVFGRDAQLLGIPADTPLVAEILLHQSDEVVEDGVSPRTLGGVGLFLIYLIPNVIHHRLEQRDGQFTPETVLAIIHFLAYGVEIADESLRFFGFQIKYRTIVSEEEHLRHLINLLDDFGEKVDGCHHGDALAVGTEHVIADHLSVVDDDDIVFTHHMLLGVHGVLCTSLKAHRHEETVHLTRFCRDGYILEPTEKDEVVVDERAVVHDGLGGHGIDLVKFGLFHGVLMLNVCSTSIRLVNMSEFLQN